MSMDIRPATINDAKAILDIYAPIVEQTSISFERDVPSLSEMENRISNSLKTHAYLVAELDKSIAGYAYGSFFRPRKAYEKSVEVTIYVNQQFQRQGVARKLYPKLFETLQTRGFHMALAGIALPNQASTELHRKLSFMQVGVFNQVGFKFGKWHDVEWWQKSLSDNNPR